jgi:hypothetical protein
MPQIRVSLAFAKVKDPDLHDFAGVVSISLYGNAAFPSPPIPKATLDAANEAFSSAHAAQAQGGTAATAEKNSKREALIGLLRKLARYVEDNANNDLATLLSSGFLAVTGKYTSPTASVPAPTIYAVVNGDSGQIILRVTAVKNSRGYIVRFVAIGPDGKPGPETETDPLTDSRKLTVNGLTPGTLYSFQVRATLARSRVTDWSDAVRHRSL